MTNIKKVFRCPSCGKNLFDVGVTRCTTGSRTVTVVDFNNDITIVHNTRINSSSEEWVKCNHCHNGMDIEIYQLNEVLTGEITEELMKIQCGISCKPVFECPGCKKDIFKEGFREILYGGIASSEITMCSDGYDTKDADIVDFTEQWSECSSCGERININAIDLINYYEGECTLEDILGKEDN